MSKADLMGVLVAVIVLTGLSYVLADGSRLPLLRWPVEALNGLAFSFAWGLGMTTALAYGCAIFSFIVVAVTSYRLAKKLFSRLLS